MKIVVHAHPTEWLPREVWAAVRNAFVMVAGAWGVGLEIEETLSVQEAERRSNVPREIKIAP